MPNALPWTAPGKGPFPETGTIPLPPVRDSGRWLIALDLDGTTVNADNQASARVRAAITAAQAAGDEVMIATGRPIHGVLGIYDDLGLTSKYAVCSNGALVTDMRPDTGTPYKIVDMTMFDPAPVIDAISPNLPDARYALEDADQGYRFDRPFMAGTFGARTQKVTLEELRSKPVTRIIVVSPGHDIDEFHAIVDRIGLHQVSYSVGWTAWLDIAPYGVNKATALEKVRRRLGIPKERVLAIGDGMNDREMLEWAADGGRGVAMGHALDEVKARGNLVVGDLEDDGVAEAIEGLLAAAR